MSEERFNTCQFFANGDYEYVRRVVPAEDAMKAAMHYITCIGAQVGTTVRVIVTDMDDCIVFEWKREEGITHPPDERGKRYAITTPRL